MISMIICPLKELDTSPLSASPRSLTEGVLKGEGPTSADAGVASCLLLMLNPGSDVYPTIFGMVRSLRSA